MLEVPSGSINVVPGRCKFSLDMRAPNNAQRDALAADVLAKLKEICERRGVRYTLEEACAPRPRPARPNGSSAGRSAVDALGVPLFRMPSGAGHDAMKLHEVMPQAMLFVRGINSGISHNPLESSTNDDMQLAVEAFQLLLDNLATEQTDAMTDYDKLDAWIDAHFDEEVRFLQELVRVPTDTPPGNNAPHAERTAELLKASASRPRSTPCRRRR